MYIIFEFYVYRLELNLKYPLTMSSRQLFTHIVFFILAICTSIVSSAQWKKDGTPDMRYSSNKSNYGNSYSSSGYGTNSSTRFQNGYVKSNGTYVQPHYKTDVNSTNWDNFSTKDNYNYYNGSTGSRARDYSPEAYNYGSGKPIYQGPNGGQYYYNDKGNKTYVPKRW